MRARFWVHRQLSSPGLTWRRGRQLSGVSSTGANPSHEGSTLMTNYLLKATPSKDHHSGNQVSHMNFVGIQAFSLQHAVNSERARTETILVVYLKLLR